MKVTWHPAKAKANLKKHGIDFSDAEAVLFDPDTQVHEDIDTEGEQRFIALGEDARGRVLVVVYTYRDESIHLISAWEASKAQRRYYEENRLR